MTRRRPPRLAPVRPARRRRAQPRPRPARPDRRLSARVDRRAALRASGALYETYNKGLSILPTAELPWYRVTWDRIRAEHEGETFDEHADLVDELLERIRPTARCRRPTSSRARRSTGTGGRPTRSGPSSRRSPRRASSASPGATATAASTTSSSGSSRRTCSPSAGPTHEQFRHKLLSRYRAHGLLGASRAGRALARDSGAPCRRRTDAGLAGPRGAPRGARGRALIVPVDGRGRPRRSRYVLGRRSCRSSTQARAGGRAPASRPADRRPASRSSRPLDPLVWDRDFLRIAATTSTTSGRSTSRPPSVAGATTSCRSCSATGWSAGSSRGSSARPARSGSSDAWWEDGLRPAGGARASSRRSPTRSMPIGRSGASARRRLAAVGPASGARSWRSAAAAARAVSEWTTTAPWSLAGRLAIDQAPQLPALSRARTRNS